MPRPSERVRKTRRQIVRSARALFNRHGFEGVTIEDIMGHAGLTRGGFYKHFRSKGELYALALEFSKEDPLFLRRLPPGCSPSEVARVLIRSYLSTTHFETVEESCALVTLPSDVARSDPAVKRVFRSTFVEIADVFLRHLRRRADAGAARARDRALAMAAVCVGAMVVARAIDDAELANDVRAAAAELALEMGGLTEGASRATRRRPSPSRRKRTKASDVLEHPSVREH